MNDQISNYNPDIAILPGETLAETLDYLGMSQKELAQRMGRPEQTISEIIHGKKQIIYETAIELERALGISAKFWNNLEQNYRATLARIEDEKRLIKEVELARKYPYLEMARLGWIANARNRVEQVKNLLNYFGVQSLGLIEQTLEVAFRKASTKNYCPYAMAAWLRRGEVLFKEREVSEFDSSKVKSNIEKFRDMTNDPPSIFEPKLIDLCVKCGISLVFVPHLKKTYVQGATRWLTPTKALIQLSLRYKYNDVFWFTFFHELGHIILHGKRETFIDLEGMSKGEKEIEADEFAANKLIHQDKYQRFLERNDFSRTSVIRFSRKIGVSPSIIVGRLQHDQKISFHQLNDLRTKFEFKK